MKESALDPTRYKSIKQLAREQGVGYGTMRKQLLKLKARMIRGSVAGGRRCLMVEVPPALTKPPANEELHAKAITSMSQALVGIASSIMDLHHAGVMPKNKLRLLSLTQCRLFFYLLGGGTKKQLEAKARDLYTTLHPNWPLP